MPDINGFDANEHEPQGDFTALPKGDYLAMATESEWKETKKKDGEYMQFVLEVLEEGYEGRKLWARLNLKNKSAKAVTIANGELSSICRAVGIMRPKSTDDLHNIPMIVSVDTEEYQGKTQNKVTGYKAVNGKRAAPAQAAAPTAAAAPASGGRAPWLK